MGLFSKTLNASTAPAQDGRTSWWLSLFVLCAVLGALIGLSFKTQNRIRQYNVPASNYPALVQEYLILKKNVNDQQSTIKGLRQDNAKLVTTTSSGGNQARVLAAEVSHGNFLAGLTAVQGPGLVVTLNDSKTHVPGALPAAIMPTLIHDTDINAVLNELKAAGAEAISVNDQRVIATSPVRCAGATVYVNGTPQTPPYIIRVIGSPKDLQTALNLPGGVADSLRQIDTAMIKMQKVPRVTIPAYSGAFTPRYARPVAPALTATTPKDAN